ncbi:L,D-transpeptidase family protein [Roseomonas xinghualingensis]|uniref:L,D-transpeptidase family protein n=1 Tax=Roseomonas xinghualingensis TaxID=2986475 RepID=UPI0021F0D187|nr:L,D-transpeptidase family protein [Roseomonas sp. SXEYE001]MCV4206711.1 L,D-transpeptidase family protein [Roseomonas sp. SXEYE001]
MRRRDAFSGLLAGLLPVMAHGQALPAPAGEAGAEAAPILPAGPGPRNWDSVFRLAARLRKLGQDGLDIAAYAIPPDEMASSEPAAFHAGVYYAANAALGDLVLGRLRQPSGRGDILRDPAKADFPRWQAELVGAPEPASLIDRAANLPEGAAALRAELAKAGGVVASGGWQPIPPGVGTLEPGTVDPQRIPALRARLKAEDPLLAAARDGGDLYDAALEASVRRWQTVNGLEVDGRVGPISQAVLNRPASARVAQIRAALDMRRNAVRPGDERRIEVSIADYLLTVEEGSRVLLRMNVIVGKPARATPPMRARMTSVQFNPAWGVPERNAREDLLPRFRRDPAGMTAKGYRLYTVVGGERIEVDPTTVNWSTIRADRFPYLIRQDAGDNNALGRIKFIMPNSDDIYLHDTPDRTLFRRPDRAFSSGCIRLERPNDLLSLVLEGTGWDPARVQRAYDSRQTQSVALRRTLPVRLHYTTVVVEGSRVRIRPDIYGLDAAYVKEMDRGGVRVAAAGGAPR